MSVDKKYGNSMIPSFIDIALMRRNEEVLHWHKHMVDMIGTSVVGKTPEAMLDELPEGDDKSVKRQKADDHNR